MQLIRRNQDTQNVYYIEIKYTNNLYVLYAKYELFIWKYGKIIIWWLIRT